MFSLEEQAGIARDIREKLERGEQVRILPGGVSMLPTFRPERDIIILSPVPQTLKKYDVIFFQRPNGKPVLHRIVAVGETFTCLGDNQLQKEPGVKREQILGLVTGFIRNGREHSVEERGYQFAFRFWRHTKRFRHIIACPQYYLRRLLKCLRFVP